MPFLDLAQPPPMTIERRIDAVLADPACSRWLKSSLQMALGRDPVDAVNDAEVLHELLTARTADLRPAVLAASAIEAVLPHISA